MSEPKSERRIVRAKRVSVGPKPTIWIVVLSHATINITTDHTDKKHVMDGDNRVILERIPPSFDLEYESTCSCPSVVNCDENQNETLLSYAKSWKSKDFRDKRVLKSRRRAKDITDSYLENTTLLPESTERIFMEEMGIDVIDSGCIMLPTSYLLDKSFSSEVPLIHGNLFGGSIYMFYDKNGSQEFKKPERTRVLPHIIPRLNRTRFGLHGKNPRRNRRQTKKRMDFVERELYNLLKAPFIYPLLINSSLYYYDCIDDMGMESLNDAIPFISTCEKKLIDEFPNSKRAIEIFFSENKKKEEYLESTYLMEENGNKLFDLRQIFDLSNTLKRLDVDPGHIETLTEEKIDELSEFSRCRIFRTDVSKIINLVRALFPRGANIKWMDYSCNNFSTDDVGCEAENRMLRSLLQYKKTDKTLHFGGLKK